MKIDQYFHLYGRKNDVVFEEVKWTSPNETLPEDGTRVLTTIKTKRRGKQVRSGCYFKGYFNNDNGDTWNATDKEVIAWMPLIEPWIGEK